MLGFSVPSKWERLFMKGPSSRCKGGPILEFQEFCSVNMLLGPRKENLGQAYTGILAKR
jgi:hypothetical protein